MAWIFFIRSVETSADKCIDFHPIYLPHLQYKIRSVLDFVLFGKLVRFRAFSACMSFLLADSDFSGHILIFFYFQIDLQLAPGTARIANPPDSFANGGASQFFRLDTGAYSGE